MFTDILMSAVGTTLGSNRRSDGSLHKYKYKYYVYVTV